MVATVIGGSREVGEDGVTGYVANPFDVAGYAKRIGELLRDPERRRAMGEAGHARLIDRFTIERLTSAFLEVYAAASASNREASRGVS